MEYTKLGNSDVTVSRICMGCMGFGDATKGHHSWILDADRSREIIRRTRHRVDDATDAVSFKLAGEEISDSEEPYVPHRLVGVMAFNH